jgi:hypothetical protein
VLKNIVALVVSLLACFIVAGRAQAGDNAASDLLKRLVSSEHFSDVQELNSLPKAIQRYYIEKERKQAAAVARQPASTIAPLFATGKQPWQSTCSVDLQHPLPLYHLNFCAQSGSTYVLCYLTGGFAMMEKADVFVLKDDSHIDHHLTVQTKLQPEMNNFKDMQMTVAKNGVFVEEAASQ